MTIEELVIENERLRTENATLKQRLAELETVVHDRKEQLEAAQRGASGRPRRFRAVRPRRS